MARTDIHRPSVIEPTNYMFVGFQYLKVEDLGDALFLKEERARIAKHMAETGGERSRHAHGGNCHICGAHCIYTALFWHQPTNQYIITGLDCGEKLDMGDAEGFRAQIKAAIERKAGKGKAQAYLAQANLGVAWTIYESMLNNYNGRQEEETIYDMVSNLIKYGSMTEKQINYLRILVDKVVNREVIAAQRAKEREAASPFPVGDERIVFKGIVVGIRQPSEYDMYPQLKMTIKHASGWCAFGSIPKALNGVKVGDTVEFEAKPSPSKDDIKFGYYNRPTKARFVSN